MDWTCRDRREWWVRTNKSLHPLPLDLGQQDLSRGKLDPKGPIRLDSHATHFLGGVEGFLGSTPSALCGGSIQLGGGICAREGAARPELRPNCTLTHSTTTVSMLSDPNGPWSSQRHQCLWEGGCCEAWAWPTAFPCLAAISVFTCFDPSGSCSACRWQNLSKGGGWAYIHTLKLYKIPYTYVQITNVSK